MNWANRITLSRLALTVLFVVALNSSWHYGRTTALVIFLIAGLTDFIDGEIARRYGVITSVGSDDSGSTRFFDYRIAPNGQRQRADSSSGKSGKTKDFVANYYNYLLP